MEKFQIVVESICVFIFVICVSIGLQCAFQGVVSDGKYIYYFVNYNFAAWVVQVAWWALSITVSLGCALEFYNTNAR